jgi:hypothetical protein
VNHYGLNLCNCHGTLIATAPQVNGLFLMDRVLDRTLESTEYTNIDNNNNSSLMALIMTVLASRHNAEKRMLWHRCLAHIRLKALEICQQSPMHWE